MSEIGTVVETMHGKVRVRIPHSQRCTGCHACSFIAGEAQMELIALNRCHARVGDHVELEIERSGELPASLILYGVPLLSFIIVLILFLLFASELVSFLSAIAAVAISYLLIRRLSAQMNTTRYLPSAVSICAPDSVSE